MSRRLAPLAVLIAALVLAAPASAASPDIVISQVYGGGGNAGTTLRNDFIELFNPTSTPVTVAGWSVQYGAAGGTTFQPTPLTGTIEPGRYYLVREGGGTGGTQDLPAPDASGGIAMSATAGKVRVVTAGGTVRDLVGYGSDANEFEGARPAPGLSNTTADLRLKDGCQDTDDNAADFATGAPSPRNAASPRKVCDADADAAPSVARSDPADNQGDVALGGNVEVTLSEPVTAAGGAFAISCTDSGDHALTATPDDGGTTFTLDPAADFVRNERCSVTVHAAAVTDQDANDPPDTMAADRTFSFFTVGLELRIHDIQGAQHRSPYEGDSVSQVPGIVTAIKSNGFFIQDPRPDNLEATSEGVFVFTSTRPAVAVGDSVLVSGRVSEFRSASAPDDLSLTEISSPRIAPGDDHTPVKPTLIGIGGRIPPLFVIDNDAAGGNADDPATPFDPREDGLDFHESLEGMLVRIRLPMAVGPTSSFGELPVVADGGILGIPRTIRGGVLLRPFDANPERFILAGAAGFDVPDAKVRDTLSTVTAVGDYAFDNPMYQVTEAPTLHDGGLKREVTQAPASKEVAIASMNMENLAATSPPAKFDALAHILVDNLRAPDIVAAEEIQDNNGETDNGVTDATATWNALIAAVQRAGGPTYQFRQIDPVNDQDGGAPGGNIRVGFLFRTDRGVSFVDRPGGTSTAGTDVLPGAQLTFSPGRVDPGNEAWQTSRKPLAGEFRYRGKTLFVIANHFNSKGGDDPLFGRIQPPQRISEVQRHKQATVLGGFVDKLLKADRNANAVVLGDFNDFDTSETLDILKGDGRLANLMDTLPVFERYSYVFEGNSQVLDQILVSRALAQTRPAYDSVHVNAEFPDQASDHDPQVTRIRG